MNACLLFAKLRYSTLRRDLRSISILLHNDPEFGSGSLLFHDGTQGTVRRAGHMPTLGSLYHNRLSAKIYTILAEGRWYE
jgi:hypothetical protein